MLTNRPARYGICPLRAFGASWRLTMALVVRLSPGQIPERQIQCLDSLLSRRAICQVSRTVHQRRATSSLELGSGPVQHLVPGATHADRHVLQGV